MDAHQLNSILKADPCLKHYVWGVFPRDQLPQTLLPGGYVVNTDNARGPGVHWIALWVQHSRIDFFDSFGHVPEHYGWTFSIPTLCNIIQIQADDSSVCGAYCIYFLLHRCQGRSMEDIITDFSSDRHSNDRIVSDFIM